MNITSNNALIYAKEFNGKTHYRAGLANKLQNGEYDRAYIDVRFPKGTELENKTKIKIKKGFLSFYNAKDIEDKIHTLCYIVVQEFEEIQYEQKPKQEKVEEEKKDPYEMFGTQITVEDLDLPF